MPIFWGRLAGVIRLLLEKCSTPDLKRSFKVVSFILNYRNETGWDVEG